MVRIKKSPILFLLLIFFFINSCSNDNSVTSSDQSIRKTNDAMDINSGSPWGDGLRGAYNKGFHSFAGEMGRMRERYNLPPGCDDICFCLFIWLTPKNVLDSMEVSKSIAYEFRDNYLLGSNKGKEYIIAYLELSAFSIKYNLINRYHREHYELLKNSAYIARDLQYGNNNNQILINDKLSEDLKEILMVYRNHPNHSFIDPVLDYLEADLIKYENKPKSVIQKDFINN